MRHVLVQSEDTPIGNNEGRVVGLILTGRVVWSGRVAGETFA